MTLTLRRSCKPLALLALVCVVQLVSLFETSNPRRSLTVSQRIPALPHRENIDRQTDESVAPCSVETLYNGRVQPRAFDPWPINQTLPCFPPDGLMFSNGTVTVNHDRPVDQGFFFLKTYKTGSSTSAGVNLRLARNIARRQQRDFDFCKARFNHGIPWKFHGATLFGNRNVAESFLWAILRDPTKRAISLFYHFKVSRFRWEATPANFRKALRVDKRNYYVRTLSTRPFFGAKHNGLEFANEIIQDYDFIGITERIDESFVALAMLLRIPLSDVLYLSAKQNGGYDDHCIRIQPASLTTNMQKFIESDEWQEIIKEDLALYKAANQSLDLTIERLGSEKFAKNLAVYKAALEEANRRCLKKTVFPCTKDGERVPPAQTDCLWSDAGCGTDCLDQVASAMGLNTVLWHP